MHANNYTMVILGARERYGEVHKSTGSVSLGYNYAYCVDVRAWPHQIFHFLVFELSTIGIYYL